MAQAAKDSPSTFLLLLSLLVLYVPLRKCLAECASFDNFMLNWLLYLLLQENDNRYGDCLPAGSFAYVQPSTTQVEDSVVGVEMMPP